MFRHVKLPGSIPGRLYLHSMPGRYEPFEDARKKIRDLGITRVVCLAPLQEIRTKSPDYASALIADDHDWQQASFPVSDFDAPEDREGFLTFVLEIAQKLASGERILIHCGAGHGRTGMAAITLLMASGLAPSKAMRLISDAGSEPERPVQYEFLQWAARKFEI